MQREKCSGQVTDTEKCSGQATDEIIVSTEQRRHTSQGRQVRRQTREQGCWEPEKDPWATGADKRRWACSFSSILLCFYHFFLHCMLGLLSVAFLFNSGVETFCCCYNPLTPYTISQLLGLQDITLNRITQKRQRHKSIIASYLFFISTCACRRHTLLQPLPPQNIFSKTTPPATQSSGFICFFSTFSW